MNKSPIDVKVKQTRSPPVQTKKLTPKVKTKTVSNESSKRDVNWPLRGRTIVCDIADSEKSHYVVTAVKALGGVRFMLFHTFEFLYRLSLTQSTSRRSRVQILRV
jgi:hypothetical protein